MKSQQPEKINFLINHGVDIPQPATVEIGPEVRPERIAPGVLIHSGCRIRGEKTLIMAGARLGEEGPVTLQDCQLGEEVELKGGFFRESTFLKGVNIGFGAQVREGCLLEEQSGGAHTIGLKQTILLPFVTLGSLINFCDCLMAGGTSRKNHSEVGSSYIHFNYTPQQDKATPSLIGDVPRGVMLNQPPIFLGGQGGLVGPSIIGYGTVIAAGTISRQDYPEGGKTLFSPAPKRRELDFYPGVYWRVERRIRKNINYLANLIALRQWYLQVRSLFLDKELQRGALKKLEIVIDERIKRLRALAAKMDHSAEIYNEVMAGKASRKILTRKKEFSDRWEELEAFFTESREKTGFPAGGDIFLEEVSRGRKENKNDYIAVIQGLDEKATTRGTRLLQSIVDEVNRGALEIIPSFK